MQTPPPESLSDRALAQDGGRLTFHGTGVAIGRAGVLILGPSGSGKSSIALDLMAHGGQIIADDSIWLEAAELIRPDTAPTFVEARGIGLLNAGPVTRNAHLNLVVDLSRPEPYRLPPRRITSVHGQNVSLILGAGQFHLVPAILHLLRHGKFDPDL